MFSTTLRIPDDLGAFLQETARAQSLSVNACLARLLEDWREAERHRRLAQDWADYAADSTAQDIEYAFPAQAEMAAEKAEAYRTAPRRKRRP